MSAAPDYRDDEQPQGGDLGESQVDELDDALADEVEAAKQQDDPDDPGASYRWRICGLEPLPNLEPEEALAAFQRGDRDTLVRSVLRMVRSFAKQFRERGGRHRYLDWRTAEAVAYEGASAAAVTWIPGRGRSWPSWARLKIRGALHDWERKNWRGTHHVSTVTQRTELGGPSSKLDDAVGENEDEGALDEHKRFPKPPAMTLHRQRDERLRALFKMAEAERDGPLGACGPVTTAAMLYWATADLSEAEVETTLRTGRAPDGAIPAIQAAAGCGETTAKKAWKTLWDPKVLDAISKLEGAEDLREMLQKDRGPVRRRRGGYWR